MGAAGNARAGVSDGGLCGQGAAVPGRGSQALGSGESGSSLLAWVKLGWPCPSTLLGAGSLGLAWAGRIGGRTKAHKGQEVALGSSRDGVAS